ncbi:MAG: c-type cytochrome domain-containing protein [Bacteroidia bacterium]
MKRIFSIILGLGLLMTYSCKHELFYPEQTEPTTPIVTDTTGTGGTVEDTMVCFESEILPIFQSSCAMTGCHDAITHEEGIRLYTYSGIMQEIVPFQPTEGDIMESITDDDPDKIMPPPPHIALSSNQIALIERWIMQGAQNTINCEGDVCDSTAFAYANDIVPIVSTHCNGCHSGNFPSAGINTSNHAGLTAIALNGSLVASINHISPYSAMPQNALMLDICKRTKIKKWVLSGAPNN